MIRNEILEKAQKPGSSYRLLSPYDVRREGKWVDDNFMFWNPCIKVKVDGAERIVILGGVLARNVTGAQLRIKRTLPPELVKAWQEDGSEVFNCYAAWRAEVADFRTIY